MKSAMSRDYTKCEAERECFEEWSSSTTQVARRHTGGGDPKNVSIRTTNYLQEISYLVGEIQRKSTRGNWRISHQPGGNYIQESDENK